MTVPVFYPAHYLAGSTVTVTGEDPNYPAYNLSDRGIVELWKDNGFSGFRIIQAQWTGVTPIPAWDTWIIPNNHGLVGVACSLQTSPDGSAWTIIDAVTPTTTKTIKRTIAPVSPAWMRLVMSGASAAPYMAELYISKAVVLPISAKYNSSDGVLSDVTRRITPGGVVRKAKNWGPRFYASYQLPWISEDSGDWKALMDAIFTVLDSRFCYMTDILGQLQFVELTDPKWTGVMTPIRARQLTLTLQAVADTRVWDVPD
jgi:hypothetical protein